MADVKSRTLQKRPSGALPPHTPKRPIADEDPSVAPIFSVRKPRFSIYVALPSIEQLIA
jgi:hypothetical protein